MDSSALQIGIALGVAVVLMTGFAVYTSFGPPAKQLADPFDDHDD